MKIKIKKISKSLLVGTSIAAAIVVPSVISQAKITSFAGNKEVIPLFYDDTIVTTEKHQSATRYFEGGKFNVTLDGHERTYKNSIFDDDRVTWEGQAKAKFEGLDDTTPDTITSEVVGFVYGSGRPTFSAGAIAPSAALPSITANATFNVSDNEKTSTATFKDTSEVTHYYDGAAKIWKLWSHGQRHVATVQAKNWFLTLASDSDFYSDSNKKTLTHQEQEWKNKVDQFQKGAEARKKEKAKKEKQLELKNKRKQEIKDKIDEQQDELTLLRQQLEKLKIQLELKKLQSQTTSSHPKKAKRSVATKKVHKSVKAKRNKRR